MRSALQAASVHEKTLAERGIEITELKNEMAKLDEANKRAADLEGKVASLESEIESVSTTLAVSTSTSFV
jgi:uncharacterized coiled-coil protein SlyX